MNISYYGEGCFKIQSLDTTFITNPFDASTGLTPPRFKTDFTVKTLNSYPIAEERTDEIVGPGQYNIKNIDISGFSLQKESSDKFIKTIYIIKAEDIKMCFLGHISQMPDPETSEFLEEIDILFIPAGGRPFIEIEASIKLIKQIEPKIIIPSFHKIPGLKRQAGDLKEFLKEINHEKVESQDKLSIKKKDLESIKKTEVIVLKT